MPAKRRLPLRTYAVVSDAVEAGAAYGLRRFFKHRDDGPDDATLAAMAEAVENAVMASMAEVVDFDRAG